VTVGRRTARAALALVAALGFVAGAVVTLASTGGGDGDAARADLTPTSATPAPTSGTSTRPPTTVAATDPPTDPAPASTATPGTATATAPAPAVADDDALLVWTSQGLAPGFGTAVAGMPGVASSTVVAGDQLGLVATWDAGGAPVTTVPDGWQIPLDLLGIEPAGFARFAVSDANADVFAALQPGEALLTRTAADLRDIGVGGTLQVVGGGRVEVVGVVDDLAGAGAEVLVDRTTAEGLGVTTERYVLVELDGPRADVQAAIDAVLDPQRSVRFRNRAETTWMRHGDAVLPLVLIKAQFGEFAFRDMAGRDVEIEQGWFDANIVSVDVPVLGQVRCHRAIVDALHAAMQELVDRNLAQLVDPDHFAGCFVPRRIEEGAALSRHSWGVAVDLNVYDNPRGTIEHQDRLLVQIMDAHGFTSGQEWLLPDPAHYEWNRDR
jgi:hypothetical protein